MWVDRVGAERTTCARHRNVETYLRCAKCGTPICPKCLVHTPVGARCPSCAAPPRSFARGVSVLSYALSTAAGLAVGMLAGVVLVVAPLGAFMILPLLLTGFLVGEAMSAAARRRGGNGLAVLAFVCTVAGPILGRAAFVAAAVPVQDPVTRASVALVVALQSLGALELLLLAVAGIIAATRVRDR